MRRFAIYHCSENIVTLYDITPETSLVWESSRNLPNISRKSRLVMMITCTACQVFSCCTCRLYRRPWLQPGAKELKTKSAGLISNKRLVVMYPENLHGSHESCFLVGFVVVVVFFSLVVTYNPNLYTLSQVRICLFLIKDPTWKFWTFWHPGNWDTQPKYLQDDSRFTIQVLIQVPKITNLHP